MAQTKSFKKGFFIFLFLFLCPASGSALNMDTHEKINKFIAKNPLNGFSLGNYLYDRIGFENREKQMLSSSEVLDWFIRGGSYEDDPPGLSVPYFRSRNHFHNPLQAWDNAYYSDWFSFCDLLPVGHCPVSAILWANGPQTSDWAFIGPIYTNLNPGGDWSWSKTRQYFFTALTSTAKTDRDMNFANTFRGLGQVMHLLEDMSVPDHTRNTFHPLNYHSYEGWVSKDVQYDGDIARYSPNDNQFFTGTISGIASFFDTDQYIGSNSEVTLSNTAGLSEYSNANFFSNGSIFSPAFPNPSWANIFSQVTQVPARDGSVDNVIYLYLNGQNQALAMAQQAYFADDPLLDLIPAQWRYNLDDKVYKDYASVLLPRAIGYSAGLMSYFFRGTIDVQPLPDANTRHSISVTAQNTTANGDDMLGGDVSLVVRFRELQEDGSGVVRTLNYAGDYQYRVYTLGYQTDIPKSYSKPLAFDLSANPLPAHLTDVNLQSVYRGRLGYEDGAVGVGAIAMNVGSEIDISLPATGMYAMANPDNVFTGIALTASARVTGLNLADGLIELEVGYRLATSDPFASVPVDTTPVDAVSKLIRVPEKNGVKTLPQGTPVGLQFDLPAGQLPWYATDVYLNLVYRRAGDPETKTMAVGFHDISEPTPVDLFNNTDKVCLNGNWYDAGSQAAIDIVDSNHDGWADLEDVFPHNLSNVYVKFSPGNDNVVASTSDYDLFVAGPVVPNELRRLGYVLTDYDSFHYSYLAKADILSPYDLFAEWFPAGLYPGTGAKNQFDSTGFQTYPGMYVFRGMMMWWGTGIIFTNPAYPAGSSCNPGEL
jgi:hypothetical protein